MPRTGSAPHKQCQEQAAASFLALALVVMVTNGHRSTRPRSPCQEAGRQQTQNPQLRSFILEGACSLGTWSTHETSGSG